MAKRKPKAEPAKNELAAPPRPGGAPCALDMTNDKDRAMVRDALREYPKRWAGVTPEVKQQILEDLGWARDQARACPATLTDPLAGAKVVVSVAKTFAMIEGQNQADEHKANEKPSITNINNGPTVIEIEFDKAG
jgi:hypothetical protein